jgi:hypothetical protein
LFFEFGAAKVGLKGRQAKDLRDYFGVKNCPFQAKLILFDDQPSINYRKQDYHQQINHLQNMSPSPTKKV